MIQVDGLFRSWCFSRREVLLQFLLLLHLQQVLHLLLHYLFGTFEDLNGRVFHLCFLCGWFWLW